MLKQYQCCNGHGQFLYKSEKPFPDKYAFNVDRPSFKLINPHVDWATKEEWEKTEKKVSWRQAENSRFAKGKKTVNPSLQHNTD
jgi:hypothetical protein